MSFEYFIAKRIHFQQGKKNVSRPAVRIAIIGMALGLSVMFISIAVIIGFKNEIQKKTVGFGGDIQVSNYDNNNTYEMKPISMRESLIDSIRSIAGVRHTQGFITKPGILKTESDFEGIVFKGIDSDFDWEFFQSNLLEGELLNTADENLENKVIISSYLAKRLELKCGDSFVAYFIKDNVRARKFVVSALYSTDFIEYDKLFVLSDIRHLRRLNNWDAASFSAIEIFIDDFDELDRVGDAVYSLTANRFNDKGEGYYTRTIKEIIPQIFNWLDLLDMNVWVILGLMLAVSGFIMISGLLILILERTAMIGLLKSVGARNWTIRKIFLYHLFFLISKGMIWGNLIGFFICGIQYYFKLIPLDPTAYYVSSVPIAFKWDFIILLNIGTLIASILMMIAPSYLITKISPAKVIRYE